MPPRLETDREILERLAAEKWLKEHAHEIPPVLSDEIGSEVPLGESDRLVPVVRLNEDQIGPRNDPHPTAPGLTPLSPWIGQGTAVDQTALLRPVEEQALAGRKKS